jgi:hypothetical protein
LSEQLGYRRDQNIVFAMPSDGPINISPFDSPTQPIPAEGLLKNWVDQMAQQSPRRGFAGFIMFAPEHVRILAAEGWNEEKVKDYIFNTSYNPTYLEAKKEGFTSRGPKVKANTFGLTRKPVSSPPVENCIIKGVDPVGDTFILVAGAPVGGHGAMIPRSSHGGWAVREIGTLAPPPAARPTPLWEGATPTPTPEEAPTATPIPEETPSEEEAPTPEEEEEEKEEYESVC